MAYLSLYRKYRPQTFDEILGQDHISKTLANAITEDRVAHAYLFTGPRGTGKTSTARILAKALNCVEGPTTSPCGKCPSCVAVTEGSSLDVIEMDAASHSKVDETRDILSGVPLATAGGRKKVYVIDEVHMLSTPSFNALLKTLEEPPGHVLFILATTEAHKVLPTIISRTQRFDFRRLPANILHEHLVRIAKEEGIEVEMDALGVVARHADGGARDALSVLDQLASLGGHVSVGDVEKLLGERREDAFSALFDAIAAGDIGSVLGSLHAMVAEGADVRQLAIGVLDHARSLLLVKTAPDAEALLDIAPEDAPLLIEQSGRLSVGSLLRALDLIGKALSEMRTVPNHRMLLELALVRAAAPETDPSANGLLGRIERLERLMRIEHDLPDREAPSAQQAAGPSGAGPTGAGVPAAARGQSADGAPAAPAAMSSPAPESSTAAGRAKEVSAVESEPRGDDGRADLPAGRTEQRQGAADHVGLNHVKDAWPPVLREVSKRSKRVWGLLNPSHPLALDNDVLTVEVQSEFHQSTMSQDRNRAILGESLHAALGVSPRIEFSAARPAPSEADPGGYAEAQVVTAKEDPVELVKEGFKAEVVEERET